MRDEQEDVTSHHEPVCPHESAKRYATGGVSRGLRYEPGGGLALTGAPRQSCRFSKPATEY